MIGVPFGVSTAYLLARVDSMESCRCCHTVASPSNPLGTGEHTGMSVTSLHGRTAR